jgi:hypothetical protein
MTAIHKIVTLLKVSYAVAGRYIPHKILGPYIK